ncbi:hypothetical protein BDA96_04G235200 [Sorghum bicolor]|uniref:Uncharacterized protein n=1 Tax=Sorghum bicolor TaxID=4558 RepID=A0A921ULG5_SORBI|nr:hypothetical protein BDA96_04G235200 [Sorghum bicolor]
MLALLLQPPDSNLAPQVTRGRSENLLWRSMPHLSWLYFSRCRGSMHEFMLSAVPDATTAEFAVIISFVSPRNLR